ncbi:MAG: hypothetical protein ACREQ5_20450, partial [Candidatus Dormibacteria bacterium]
VILNKGHMSIVSRIPALVFQLAVVPINRTKFLVGLDVIVANSVHWGVKRWDESCEICFYVMQGRIENTTNCPIPERIVQVSDEKFVILRFSAVLGRCWQDELPTLKYKPSRFIYHFI